MARHRRQGQTRTTSESRRLFFPSRAALSASRSAFRFMSAAVTTLSRRGRSAMAGCCSVCVCVCVCVIKWVGWGGGSVSACGGGAQAGKASILRWFRSGDTRQGASQWANAATAWTHTAAGAINRPFVLPRLSKSQAAARLCLKERGRLEGACLQRRFFFFPRARSRVSVIKGVARLRLLRAPSSIRSDSPRPMGHARLAKCRQPSMLTDRWMDGLIDRSIDHPLFRFNLFQRTQESLQQAWRWRWHLRSPPTGCRTHVVVVGLTTTGPRHVHKHLPRRRKPPRPEPVDKN